MQHLRPNTTLAGRVEVDNKYLNKTLNLNYESIHECYAMYGEIYRFPK